MTDKYASEYPLPGGADRYFETLISVLRRVGDRQAELKSVIEFLLEAYETHPQAPNPARGRNYINAITKMGLWVVKDGFIRLSTDGSNLVDEAAADEGKAKRTVLDIKRQKITGYDELLVILRVKDLSLSEANVRLQAAIGVEWASTFQTRFRLAWLRSLGFVRFDGGLYGATVAGTDIVAQPHGQPPPLPELPKPPLLKEAQDIADRIEKAAVNGLTGADFEKLAAEAFVFLGFDAKVMSGPGNPDVVLDAPMGDAGYRVIVDTKSRSNGCVQQNDVNFNALNQHKAKVGADYVLVLGREFAGGNLEAWAKEHVVRLVTTEDLGELLLAYAEGVIPLDQLEPLFQGGGPTDEAVLSGILADAEHAAEAMALAGKVYDAVRYYQGRQGALNADSLFFILNGEHPVDAIRKTVEMLQSDLVGALAQTKGASLYTRLTRRMLTDRLSQLHSVMGGDAPTSRQHC